MIKGNDVAQYADSLGQTITITKLDNQTDYVDTWFTNRSYSTQKEVVKPATETDITNYSRRSIYIIKQIGGKK